MIRRGMTLVEMLVAMTATLLIMAAVAQAFSAFGNAISGGRSILELDSRMRAVAWTLRSDLAGATARPLPPLNPASAEGYLEIIEGPATDYVDTSLATTVGGSVSGDHDDVLLLTTRGLDAPFVGRAPGNDSAYESTVAEVGWFARPTPGASNPVTYTLYRKQLLVMGYVGAPPFLIGNNSLAWSDYGTWANYFNTPCDVSVRREGPVLYPNTLADLTRRECRFLHNTVGDTGTSAFLYPFASGAHQSPSPENGLIFQTPQRQGEDVVLTNVLAFDVRVFDPGVSVRSTAGGLSLVPGDPGFSDATAAASGAYVDLGHQFSTNSLLTSLFASGSAARFAGFGHSQSGIAGSALTPRIYDTWNLGYQAEGTNGLDDDTDGIFDEPPYDANRDGVFEDPGEVDTMPPYSCPLRGLEVRIRCYDPSSRQVRQVTVRHTFVPH